MYTLSSASDSVFDRVIMDKVKNDSRTVGNLWFGFPFDVIRDMVIEKGLADFTKGYTSDIYGTLSPLDLCLLYSFTNARRHYKQGRDIFDRRGALVGLPAAEPTQLLDLGSGPATALMAYADAYPGKKIDYIAIDRSEHMTHLAQEMFEGLRSEGVIDLSSTFRCSDSWDGLLVDVERPTLMISSFLFASPTFPAQCDSLCNLTKRLFAGNKDQGIAFVYINSERAIAGKGWTQFAQGMGWPPDVGQAEVADEPSITYAWYIRYIKRSP